MTDSTSVAQIRRVSELSKSLALGPLGLGAVIENIIGKKLPDMGDDDNSRSLVIAQFLAEQKGSDVGRLISALEASASNPGS